MHKFDEFPAADGTAISSLGLARDDGLRASFGHVTTWIFDLDNTLYPPDSGIWPKINERITLFLAGLFGLDGLSALALRRHYYIRYGTTLRGLIEENIDGVERYLDFVHDIDRSALQPDPALAREVGQLPGRKLIFTNGSRDHAILTARQLGLDGLFEDAFDIVAARLTPKPAEEAYLAFCDRFDVDPRRAAMFEDVARNLTVPKAKGMRTVLVTAKPGAVDHRELHDRAGENAAVDYVTDDLGEFLARLNAGRV
ncbi:MAG TPA: pyrimidine 5'-nucleotidase [Roseiarcus sp.]|nr:pyrimidine 5'-nucleotidase [Roseiarcus sp.]